MQNNYPPGLENDPMAPYNIEEDNETQDSLFEEMVTYLEERGSGLDTLELTDDGWYYQIATNNAEQVFEHKLPVKYWLVAK